MKRNKLYIILSILTCICIFSMAALSNQCGCKAIPIEEKVDVETEKEVMKEEEETEEVTEEEEEEEEPAQEEQKEHPL